MDGNWKEAARYFEFDPDEVQNDDYAYRADMTFWPGTLMKSRILILENQEFPSPFKGMNLQLQQRKFCAKLISGLTGISAKAQRKISRDIKTARAFGLMPFTTRGTKQFVLGRTTKDFAADYGYCWACGGLIKSAQPT
ncbi:hypothetical protein HAX54_029192 [Datura stramonium]|uniref:Small ribosomal subunit protein bS18c n=1 Tax=Datura stramonium TaxID=4076 RepID=A0ABS8V874_DATST|nr:hypothetical protein [Datura stramonium]